MENKIHYFEEKGLKSQEIKMQWSEFLKIDVIFSGLTC